MPKVDPEPSENQPLIESSTKQENDKIDENITKSGEESIKKVASDVIKSLFDKVFKS